MTSTHSGLSGEIACEGGPVLVANAADFRHWYGAEPFPLEVRRELHWWSSFTSELPEQFRPQGPVGHQYVATANPSAFRDQLIDAVLSRWPGADVDRSQDTWVVTRADGRSLHAALDPASEYDRAIRDLAHEAVHTFLPASACYLWCVVPGLVRFSISSRLDCLHLAQVEFSDSPSDVAEAYAHAREADVKPSGHSYEVTAGPVVVAWAPNSVRDLSPTVSLTLANRDAPPRTLDLAVESSGALLWLDPGRYEAYTGYHESETWGVSWCTLKRHAA